MKHVHFIGICGVAMSALAIACKKADWHVTGSDAGFFPPVSTALTHAGISFYPGWHPEKMGIPDLVVVGNVASSTNPEWLVVQEKKIPYLSYPEFIAKYLVKPISVVCAGTYGKTTSAALLTWILTQAGKNPSYLFGGLAIDAFDSAALTDSDISVLEGDEYKSARWDNRPKFAHYSPTHLILTGISWDHADVYPTEESYKKVFAELLQSVPKNGVVIAAGKTYGSDANLPWRYENVNSPPQGIAFAIVHDKKTYHVESPMLGEYQAANITGCFAMAHALGIDAETTIAAIKNFQGLKRRLEKRLDGPITIFDDIAHSPAKAKATLATLRKIYSGKIVAVFEPNTGNRKTIALSSYADAFNNANEVIIPALTKIKKDVNDEGATMDGEGLCAVIGKIHHNAQYIGDDVKLIDHIRRIVQSGDVVVFLGSHGFRGIIDVLIKKLHL